MAATITLQQLTSTGPTATNITASPFLFGTDDSYNAGATYPVLRPASGTNYSYETTIRASASGTFTSLSSWKFYSDGANGLGTGVGLSVKALTQAYLAFAKSHAHRWRALFAHHMAEGQNVPEWYGKKLSALFELVEEPLHALIGEAASLEARALWAGIHGVCALGIDGKLALPGVRADMDEAALLLLERYLAGTRA